MLIIENLDEKLSGGYPKNRGILITGISGACKTIFGLHLLHRLCTGGKHCVFIATDELPEDIFYQDQIDA